MWLAGFVPVFSTATHAGHARGRFGPAVTWLGTFGIFREQLLADDFKNYENTFT